MGPAILSSALAAKNRGTVLLGTRRYSPSACTLGDEYVNMTRPGFIECSLITELESLTLQNIKARTIGRMKKKNVPGILATSAVLEVGLGGTHLILQME